MGVALSQPMQTLRPRKRRKLSEPIKDEPDLVERLLDGGNAAEGFEVSESDIMALHDIEDGVDVEDGQRKWLEDCGLVSDGRLTELGRSMFE